VVRPNVPPWGGIGLAFTWGALHYLTYPTLEVVVLPLAMGVVYLLGKKHVVPVFLAVFLVFVVWNRHRAGHGPRAHQ
jgi:hypothetical protein